MAHNMAGVSLAFSCEAHDGSEGQFVGTGGEQREAAVDSLNLEVVQLWFM